MCLGSSPKRLEQPHPELVHWWLLVHSSLSIAISNSCPTLKNNSTLESWWAFNSFHFQFSVEVK